MPAMIVKMGKVFPTSHAKREFAHRVPHVARVASYELRVASWYQAAMHKVRFLTSADNYGRSITARLEADDGRSGRHSHASNAAGDRHSYGDRGMHASRHGSERLSHRGNERHSA